MKVGILGANGFIGNRLTENLHLTGFATVRPIVRSYSALASLSRFNLDSKIADGLDQSALKDGFTGCDFVVHCIAGDPSVIVGTIEPVYIAAQKAGVQRIIYLSSAMVHGQNPAPGTSEESKLDMRQPLPYNNAKVRAEKLLLKLRKKGKVEVVILRPAIVYGPRSSWITRFAEELLLGNAYLINRGKGICNGIYIDNLIHAIKLAIKEEDIDREAFLVRDAEQITWADLYRPVAEFLGYNLNEIEELQPPFNIQENRNFLDSVNNSKILKSIISPIPKKYRFLLYSAASQMINENGRNSAWSLRQKRKPTVDLERLMLYTCDVALPWKKAYKYLDYEPAVSFTEACNRITAWMRYAGYPYKERNIKQTNSSIKSYNNM